jgi:hypothetical protein
MAELRGGTTIGGYEAFHRGNLVNATITTAGLLSETDKSKLDNLATVATTGKYTDLISRPYVESETQPSSDLYNGLMWLKPSTKEVFLYYSGVFINLTYKLSPITSSFTLVSDGSTATIGIAGYNKDTDILIVHQNSTYLNPSDYVITDNTTITKASGTWLATTVIDFMVLKNNSSTPLPTMAKGISNFVGGGNEKTVAHGLGVTPSAVTVNAIQNPLGDLGDVWVRYDSTSIYVGNGGGFTGQFNWIATL